VRAVSSPPVPRAEPVSEGQINKPLEVIDMPVTDATKLPAVEPPRDPEARPGFSLGGFVPPGPTFKHWVEEAQYLASIPAELGMPRELIGQPKGVYMRMKMAGTSSGSPTTTSGCA
jgi:hypothetical protein